jgi:hypothetical protein
MLLAFNSKKDMRPKAVDIPVQKVLFITHLKKGGPLPDHLLILNNSR